MRVKMSKQPPPAPTASAVDPCPTVIQIVGRPGTGSLPSTIAPPDHPYNQVNDFTKHVNMPILYTQRMLHAYLQTDRQTYNNLYFTQVIYKMTYEDLHSVYEITN